LEEILQDAYLSPQHILEGIRRFVEVRL